MKNLQSKTLVHLPTGNTFTVNIDVSKNTHINSYISTFNRTRKMPNMGTIGWYIIKDYITFNENRKPTKSMWDWK